MMLSPDAANRACALFNEFNPGWAVATATAERFELTRPGYDKIVFLNHKRGVKEGQQIHCGYWWCDGGPIEISERILRIEAALHREGKRT